MDTVEGTKPAPVVEFARQELTGKLLAAIVNSVEMMKMPWNMLTEANQRKALAHWETKVDDAVREAVTVIATDRRPGIFATVESVQFKDGIKTTLTLDKSSDGRHDLADSAGGTVMIIIAPAARYTTGAHKVQPQPDQKALELTSDGYELREVVGGLTLLKDKMPIPGAPASFAGIAEANAWLSDHKKRLAEDRDPAPAGETTADPVPLPLPEIRPFEDGWIVIDAAGSPMAGGRKFPDQVSAEAWLQQHLGIERKPAETPPAIDPEGAAQPTEPVAGPSVEEAIKAFADAATAEAKKPKKKRDWDKAWDAVAGTYAEEFVATNYDALSSAYEEAWAKQERAA